MKNRFFSKSAPGKISLSMVLVLYTHELGKTAKKPTVMSVSPWIGRQTVVPWKEEKGKEEKFPLYMKAWVISPFVTAAQKGTNRLTKQPMD